MAPKTWSGMLTRLRTYEPSVLWIVWVVLALYALPLLATFWALVATDLGKESASVYVIGTITHEFIGRSPETKESGSAATAQNETKAFGGFRETLGSIVVPLLTAFAIKSIDANGAVPLRTLLIFLSLSGLFLISVMTSGLLALKGVQQDIVSHGKEIHAALVDATRMYSKELLTYLALIIGISLKKS